MALKDTLVAVSYYTQFDPYTYTTDNRPLVNLHDRDAAIADKLDASVQLIDVTGGVSPTTNVMPAGWAIARNGAGDYTITHTLNTLNTTIVGSVFNASLPYVFYAYGRTTSTISIKTVTLGNVATDVRFNCIVSNY